MTIATILSYMEVFDNELETGTGDVDESRSITALNMAQDLWEAVCATQAPPFMQTYATLTTTANQEYTTRPSGLLRLDDLWFIDPATSRPSYRVKLIHDVGGHASGGISPLTLTSYSQSGKPHGYTLDATRFNWTPLPDAVHTLRYYGFSRATDIAARTDTFAYDDIVGMPMAALATKILAIGVGDDTSELQGIAEEAFKPVIAALRKVTRIKPPSRYYSQVHTT